MRKKKNNLLKFFAVFLMIPLAGMIFVQVAVQEAVAGITVTSVKTLDSGMSPKSGFSNTETISFKIESYNDTPVDRVSFKFYVYDPMGMQVFYHEGNSMMGNIGAGGAELRNIPISFYTTPGNYTFKGEAIAGSSGGQTASASVSFGVYSANITLTYPPNGAKDILAQPLVFRWVATGATKYKVTVGDNAAFYKAPWTEDSFITEIQYPSEPPDPLAKLSSGKIYWWKVEGLDAADKIVARTPVPFSFSIKDITIVSNDLDISNIKISDESTDEITKVNVYITNLGNQSVSNVNVDLVVVGGAANPTQTAGLVSPQKTTIITFDAGPLSGETVTVSATVNVLDDNPKNNSITKTMKLVKRNGKILGGVTNKDTGKPVGWAVVEYEGPVIGSVKTNSGGQYKIENLPVGEYVLIAKKQGYKTSEKIKVKLDEKKAEANVDFKLVPTGEAEAVIDEPGMDELWTALKDIITDKGVIAELKDFKIYQVEMEPSGSLGLVLKKLKDGNAAISEIKLEAGE